MYTTLVSVALFLTLAVRSASADFTIDTPTLTQVRDDALHLPGCVLTFRSYYSVKRFM